MLSNISSKNENTIEITNPAIKEIAVYSNILGDTGDRLTLAGVTVFTILAFTVCLSMLGAKVLISAAISAAVCGSLFFTEIVNTTVIVSSFDYCFAVIFKFKFSIT